MVVVLEKEKEMEMSVLYMCVVLSDYLSWHYAVAMPSGEQLRGRGCGFDFEGGRCGN